MLKSFRAGNLLPHLLAFVLFNLFLYLFILIYHDLANFRWMAYFGDAHHYTTDPRSVGRPFNLFSALAQYDAQWYLKIAGSGYSVNGHGRPSVTDKSDMTSLSYAFFPLFPILIKLTGIFVSNLEVAAFITSNLLLVLNFVSLYLVITRLSGRSIAVKTVWLLFAFPFSIFYRSYFSENLQLLLSVWFFYFFMSGRLILASVFLSFLGLTKGIILPVGLVYAVELARRLYSRRIKLSTFIICGAISSVGILSWTVFNFLTTQNPFFYHSVISAWYMKFPFPPPIYNLLTILSFPFLAFHSIHSSIIDAIICVLFLVLLVWSYRRLPRLLWLYSLILWAVPFFTRDLASFSRYQSASFPIFYALAKYSSPKAYTYLLLAFVPFLLIVSLYFSSWRWIG